MSELKKQKISKILVGVDGSEESLHVVDYAVDTSRKYDAEVIALNVILSYMTIFGPAVPRYMSELKQEAQSYLDKIKEKTKTIGNNRLQLRTEMIESASAVRGIVEFAEKEKADLIIVGTRGKSGFTKLLLGSVASGVVTCTLSCNGSKMICKSKPAIYAIGYTFSLFVQDRPIRIRSA